MHVQEFSSDYVSGTGIPLTKWVCAGNAKSLPKGLCQFTLPLSVDENSCCSTSTVALDIICILNFCHFGKYEMVSGWGFNLNFPY